MGQCELHYSMLPAAAACALNAQQTFRDPWHAAPVNYAAPAEAETQNQIAHEKW
jgi:hypothetical protein